MILFLKIVMLFVAAIWGVVLGIFVPVSMLSPYVDTPAHIPILWIITAVVGFVTPCFLVKLKFYKVAAVLVLAGTGSLFVVHAFLTRYDIPGFGWFYLPLLIETAAVVLISILNSRQKRLEKANAPAESILFGSEDKRGSEE